MFTKLRISVEFENGSEDLKYSINERGGVSPSLSFENLRRED